MSTEKQGMIPLKYSTFNASVFILMTLTLLIIDSTYSEIPGGYSAPQFLILCSSLMVSVL